MRTLQTLLDEARDFCRTDTELARRLGKSRTQIVAMRDGSEPLSPETVALLCDVLELSGEEARRLAALAIVENPKNAKRRAQLARAFLVCWVGGAVATSLHYAIPTSDAAATDPATTAEQQGNALYIVRNLSAWLARLFCRLMLSSISGWRLQKAGPTACRLSTSPA